MAQHDYNIANQSGASFRQDLNNALSAIVSLNSGAAAPSTTFAYQLWADTTAGVLKIRNAANNAWITLAELDGTLTMETGTAGSPGLYFRGDTNTGIFSTGADEFNIATGGAQRLLIDSTGKALFGPGTARAVGGTVTSSLSIETLGQALAMVRNSADTSGAIIALGKSRATTAGGITAVVDADILGELRFCGANGTDMSSIGAHIRAVVDGQVGTAGDTTDMPAKLVFSTTPNGEATATQRLAIASDGALSAVVPGNSTLYPATFARAWVNFDGTGTPAIRASNNVSSITDNGVGDYTVNFTTAMTDANYCTVMSRGNSPGNGFILHDDVATPQTSSAVRIACVNAANTATQDPPRVFVAIFR